MTRGKVIILTAPSGSGKTTLATRLMAEYPIIRFSVSATTRLPRPGETNGLSYHFVSADVFRLWVDNGLFLEYEEFYNGTMYGTLKSDVDKVLDSGYFILLDVDVKGASNVKHIYGDQCLSIYVRPPSIEILEQRLRSRGTETEQSLALRLDRARMELGYESTFDAVVINDELEQAYRDLKHIVEPFLQIP
jgi:guanylate kinase